MTKTAGGTHSKAPQSGSTWLKYGATATGGVAIGSIFPLFLFDKLGIAQLLSQQSTFTSAVYAFTVFAMVAFLILGIGSIVAQNGQLSWKNNLLFYVVVMTFVGAFVMGFGYFIYSAIKEPSITVKVSFDRYSKEVAGFRDFELKPYVSHSNELHFVRFPPDNVIVTEKTPVTIGMDNLQDLELDYSRIKHELSIRGFGPGTMSDICRDKHYRDNPVCKGWNREGMEQ